MFVSVIACSFHIVIETIAAVSFITDPESQIPQGSPAVKLVLRQYGGLLLSSNLICASLLIQPFNLTSRLLCGSLAFFHLWPCHRAYCRLRHPQVYDIYTKGTKPAIFGDPWVHLFVHSICCILFTTSGMMMHV